MPTISAPLRGVVVVCCGSARSVLVAARWYSDLGAEVSLRGADRADEIDLAWLAHGIPRANTRLEEPVQLCVTDGSVSAPIAETTVRVQPTSTRAARTVVGLTEADVAALGGVAIAVGSRDRHPLPLPPGCLDTLIGAHVAAAGLAGLLGGSQDVEVAAVDVTASVVATNAGLYEPYGIPWHRAGKRASGSGGCYPYSLFDVADGQVCLIARSGRDWKGIIQAAGSPAWAEHPRYRDLVAMGRDYPEEVDRLLAPWLLATSRSELMRLAHEHDVPAGPVHTPEEVLALDVLRDWWRESGPRPLKTTGRPFTWHSNSATDLPAEQHSVRSPPLLGERIVDLSWVWSGPAVGATLADLGADVLKIESASRPDNTRLRGRPVKIMGIADDAPGLELNPYFHAVNRGKRSVSLDLKHDEARSLLRRLCGDASMVLENLSTGVVDRFGVGPEWLRGHNPTCVSLSLRGYGAHPSFQGLRAYAPVLSSAAGIEALSHYPDEAPVGLMTFGFSDANASAQGSILALAGIFARRNNGEGSDVTLSQFHGTVAANGYNLLREQVDGRGTGGPTALAEDIEVVDASDLPKSAWVADDLFSTVTHPWLGTVTLPRLPWRFDGELRPLGRAGPSLGEHTMEVLVEELQLTSDRVARMTAKGILF